MEVIVAVGVLILLAALAVRFGHDSRELPHSKEHELASLGMTWVDVLPAPAPSTLGGNERRPIVALKGDRPLIMQPMPLASDPS